MSDLARAGGHDSGIFVASEAIGHVLFVLYVMKLSFSMENLIAMVAV